MNRSFVLLLIPVATLTMSNASPAPRPWLTRHVQTERSRLRAHFDSVLGELRARDVSRLTGAQRRSRGELTAWLAGYRNAGQFPLNDRFPTKAVPFFRDSRGVLCAMAYLVHRSGRTDIVDHIARTRNNAYIAELTDDRALMAWLDSVGLEPAEAARIQPAYQPTPNEVASKVTYGYALASIGFSGGSLATTALNVAAPTRSRGWTGVVVGSATLIAGIVGFPRPATGYALGAFPTKGDQKIAAVNLAAGAAALVTGIYSLHHRQKGVAQRLVVRR